MCTLHLFFRVFPEAPVLLAANRDELLDRRWEGPGWLSRVPRIFGPRDLVSGGTWLGVNEAGLTAALTNHEGTLASGESLCSRGLVVLETLRHGSAREAASFVSAFAPPCKSYTLLLADPEHAYVADQAGGRCTVFALEPGFHVVTNKRFDDPRDPKARHSRKRMEALASVDRLPTPGEFFAFLADHSRAGGLATPLCIHPEQNRPVPGLRFGTSSASVVAVGPDGRTISFAFAPGPPCSTPHADVTPDFQREPSPDADRGAGRG